MKKRTWFIVFIGIPASIFAIGFILYRIINAEQIISQKTYAAAVQTIFVTNYLNQAPDNELVRLMPRKGIAEDEILGLNEEAQDVHFVDPFMLGRRSMTWKFKNKNAPWGKEYKLRGQYLNYVTNNADVIVLVYAGPDGYITNPYVDVSVFKKGAAFKLLSDSLEYEKRILPEYPLEQPIIYDPTNGLRSSGDIFWPIFWNEAYGWHAVHPQVKKK